MPARMRRARAGGDDGLTLIEMMVALAVLTGSLMALLAGFITSAASVQNQQAQSKALRVALDRNEGIRQTVYADVVPGTTTSTTTSPEGVVYTYTTVVQEIDSRPGVDVPGDTVKRITTTVRWTARNGQVKTVTSTTAVAPDPKAAAADSRYVQAIQSVSTDPNPSVGVDFDGFSTEPVRVNIAMTGFLANDLVTVRWTDTGGSRTVTRQATSTDGRNWQLLIPARDIFWQIPQSQSRNVLFEVESPTALRAETTLVLYGPFVNAPTISSWTSSESPILMFKAGNSRGENKNIVNFSCAISGLQPSPTRPDSVRMTYLGEAGVRQEINLTRLSVNGTSSVWGHTFPASSTFFNPGTDQPFTCTVRRGTDGGPASASVPLTVRF